MANTKPVLIATVGLPRSGKSTLMSKLAKDLGCPIVCRDSIRLALHGQRYLAEAEPEVKHISQVMIRSLFLRGHETVICDETNFSKAARNSLKDEGWDIKWYPVNTSPEECSRRAVATGQPDLIPVIKEMYERYEPLELTDEIYRPPWCPTCRMSFA